MKTIHKILSLSFLSSLGSVSAQITFDFRDEIDETDPLETQADPTLALDNTGIGSSVTLSDSENPLLTATLTTVDVIGADGSLASDGFNHTTNIAASQNALGINTDPTLDDEIDGDAVNFQVGEGWVFSFDVDVNLLDVELESLDEAISVFSVSSGETTLNLMDSNNEITGFFVEAGTPITLRFDSTTGDDVVRVESLTIEAIPPVSTARNLEWSGGVSGIWDTTSLNFTDIDTNNPTQFIEEDNVTINSSAEITLDAAGITAGSVSANADAISVSLTGGDLSAGIIAVSEAGVFQVGNEVEVLFSMVSEGTLEVLNSGEYVTGGLDLAGGATFVTAEGSTAVIQNALTLGEGGGTLNLSSDLTVPSIENTLVQTPLTKEGDATLTVTGAVGVQNTGQVDLNILAGSVVFSGSQQVNIGLDRNEVFDPTPITQIDGDLVLDGPLLMLHGSQLSGTGSIRIQSPSSIVGRFQSAAAQNSREVNIQLPVILESDFSIGSDAGDNDLFVNSVISGTGNLIKIGNGDVFLEAVNTYVGSTTIETGNLMLGNAFLPDDQAVVINVNDSNPEDVRQGRLFLTHAEGDIVESLTFDGVLQAPGTYGSSDVQGIVLDNVDDVRFGGTGWLVVPGGGPIEIVDSGFEGEDFFIELGQSITGFIVTSSEVLDFDNATTVNTIPDPNNGNRFLIPAAELTETTDFFRVELSQ